MAKGSDGVMQAFGYLYPDELQLFKHLVKSLPANSTCVNIGAGSGTSGLVFLESPMVGKLYTIDLYKESRPEGALENEMNAMRESGYGDDPRYYPVQGDSIKIGKHWGLGKVDMVFIDGDHSYEHCLGDIKIWLPHIKTNGVLAVHDYQKDVWPGVEKAVKLALSKKYPLIGQASTLIAFRVI